MKDTGLTPETEKLPIDDAIKKELLNQKIR